MGIISIPACLFEQPSCNDFPFVLGFGKLGG